MSMKKILMAAVAVTALTAGSANALSLVADNSFVGTVALSGGVAAVPYEAYTLANEYNLTAGTIVPAKLTVGASSALSAGTSYLVTFTVSGGTFDVTAPISQTEVKVNSTALLSAGATFAAAGATGGDATISLGTFDSATAPTQVSFVVNTGTTVNTQFITWKLAGGIKPNTAKAPVNITSSIAFLNSPTLAVDGGAIAPVTLIDYRSGIAFATPVTNSPTLSLTSAFKTFGTATDLSAQIGSAVGFSVAAGVAGTNPNDTIYKDLAGTALATSDIASIVLTIAGDTSVQKPRLGTAQVADVATAPGVITANAANLATLRAKTATISLDTAGTATGVESTYTVTPVITLGSSLLPATYSAKSLGSVTFEGTSIFAPWVGDGSNGIAYSIRLGNKSTSAAITSVKASLLNPATTGTSGTVASTATCELGTIAAKGELVVTSANLVTCFGAFKRSDVRLTIQGAPATLTAKMRATAAGVQTESSLGSGVTAFTANN